MVLLRRYFGIILVLVLSIFAILPLFRPGFFPMHDDTQVVRVYEMGKALKDGMFPVRWVADLGYGYGYPIFNFYAPLAYYVGGMFSVLGFDALISTKIMMGLGIVLSGVFMYLLAREFWGEIGGIVAGLFYVYAPYHAVDIYVRGDVGEFYAYAFIPLTAWGFYRLISEQHWKWVMVSSLGFAGVILSHNLTAMMITPFLLALLVIYCFFSKEKLYAIRYSLYAIVLGLGLTVFYWLPALLEMKYTNVLSQIGGGANFRDHFICIGQIWNSQWGFGGSVPGCIDGLSFKLGKLNVLLPVITLLTVVILKIKSKLFTQKTAIGLSFFGFIISIFLTLEISRFFWEAIPLMAFFQYPWRFLILASFFSSFIAGAVFWYFKDLRFKLLALCALLIALLFYNIKYFQPQKYLPVSADDYVSEANIKWTTSKISDEYMPSNFKKPTSAKNTINNKIIVENGSVEMLSEKTQSLTSKITVLKNSKAYINIAYFPAWNVMVDGKKTDFKVLNNGINVLLDKGSHIVDVQFIQTPIEKITNVISLAGLTALIAGIIYSRKKIIL